MKLGVTVFATDRTLHPAQLARAVEERGFSSLYLPEHTHMPQDPKGPLPAGTTELDHDYRRTLDPYVALAVAAGITTNLELGTGVALVAQHHPLTLAKEIATLDHLAGGRFVLGIGYGWNRAEVANHGVEFRRRRAVTREHVLAMQAVWRDDVASFTGEFVSFDPTWSWPKPVQRPRVRTLIGGAAGPTLFAHIAEFADGWMPFGGAGAAAALPDLAAAFERVGRNPNDAQVVPFGTIPTAEKLAYYEALGIEEVVLRIPNGDAEEVLPALDALSTFL
jgi:probable F420-dependent oxidoreductase